MAKLRKIIFMDTHEKVKHIQKDFWPEKALSSELHQSQYLDIFHNLSGITYLEFPHHERSHRIGFLIDQ